MKYIFFFLFAQVFSQNNVCFEIAENPNQDIFALQLFTKYVNVLDCIDIYAESSISDEKVLHAAAITAELLDNNEDGIIDDSNVELILSNKKTIIPLLTFEGSDAEDILFSNFDDLEENYNYCASAVLYSNEISPQNPGFWSQDASIEEILHTINSCAQVEIYPDIFGLEPNSSYLSIAMDEARGGQFLSVPDEYPEESWYHYNDWTCDYECMAIEYLYWCIVSNMALLDNNFICNGIADEWELCTQQDFQNTDLLMYAIITDPGYYIPQLAPDGNYCIANSELNNIISKENKKSKFFDILGRPVKSSKKGLFVELFNDGKVKLKFRK